MDATGSASNPGYFHGREDVRRLDCWSVSAHFLADDSDEVIAQTSSATIYSLVLEAGAVKEVAHRRRLTQQVALSTHTQGW